MPAMLATPALPEPGRAAFRIALTREVTCIRSLAWRVDLPAAIERSETGGGDPDGSAGGAGGRGPPPLRGIDWPRLGAALEAAGLVRRPPVGAMQRFATASGDELSLIPTTGRVQFRVHYTVPEHERRFAAERLFQLLFHALRRP
jgi:hypothetical protein